MVITVWWNVLQRMHINMPGPFLFVSLQFPDGKEMQINLTGFLNAKNARALMGELWELLNSAQENIGGIPAKFVEQKKEEIKRKQVPTGYSCGIKTCV